jgi:hypothetical protein
VRIFHIAISCFCLSQICSMFWPEELGPISKDRCTILGVFLIFLHGFSIKKYFPSTLCCFFFSGFNACSHWHGSLLSYFFNIMFTYVICSKMEHLTIISQCTVSIHRPFMQTKNGLHSFNPTFNSIRNADRTQQYQCTILQQNLYSCF